VRPLPEHPDGQAWHFQTRAWWEACWTSPMRAEYTPADRHGLAVLVQAFWRADSPTARASAAPRCLTAASYGLTPMSRRRLGWVTEHAEDGQDRDQRQSRRSTAGADPRRGLHGLPPAP
jgi:hypothetical protein